LLIVASITVAINSHSVQYCDLLFLHELQWLRTSVWTDVELFHRSTLAFSSLLSRLWYDLVRNLHQFCVSNCWNVVVDFHEISGKDKPWCKKLSLCLELTQAVNRSRSSCSVSTISSVTPYLFTSANPKHTLPSDVILRRTTFFQPISPPSGPCNAPWFSSETLALYKSLTYLLTNQCKLYGLMVDNHFRCQIAL